MVNSYIYGKMVVVYIIKDEPPISHKQNAINVMQTNATTHTHTEADTNTIINHITINLTSKNQQQPNHKRSRNNRQGDQPQP